MPIYNEYSKLTEGILGISIKIFMQSELPSEKETGLIWTKKILTIFYIQILYFIIYIKVFLLKKN
jgi:hypothetical protein